MAEHKKFYPAYDHEAPQTSTAEIVSCDSSKSNEGPKSTSCCCKCLCWTTFLLVLLIVIIGIVGAIIYFVFQPKIPKYSVDSIQLTQFNLNNDMNLNATFNVTITAINPNKNIAIYYESGSHIGVWYKGAQLCQGSLPEFYLGHQNTKVLEVALTVQVQNATDLLESLQAQLQTGSILLRLGVKVPVRIKLGSLKLIRWKCLVMCSLEVDGLAADNVISARSNGCKFRL